MREVKEETNVDAIPDETKRYVEEYLMDNGNMKQVIYFVSKQASSNIKAQESEIAEITWLPFEKALETITYDNTRELLLKVLKDEGYIS